MNPKRVLFIIPYAPNLIRVRPYNLIRHIAERGHRVTVLTLWSDRQEQASLKRLEPYVERVISVRLPKWRSLWNSIKALPTWRPLQSVYCWEPELARQLASMIDPDGDRLPFDVIHVEHLRGAEYGLYVKSLFAGRPERLPIVWDSVDSISMLFRQAAEQSRTWYGRSITRLELKRTERYEAWLLDQFDLTAVTSPADREALVSLLSDRSREPEIAILPNGVDLQYFRPDETVQREMATLVVSGKMSYHANVTMVLYLFEEIMPLVWARHPEARLVVVGKDPVKEIVALDEHPNVTVTGTVEDLPPYLQRATVAIAPIAYGAGIQNKVLEAMACGTPVVTSRQAVTALQAEIGRDLLVGDGAADFANRIIMLLENPELRKQLGDAGRCYVEAYHHWGNVAARLDDLYAKAIEACKST